MQSGNTAVRRVYSPAQRHLWLLVRRILAVRGSLTTMDLYNEAVAIYGDRVGTVNSFKTHVLRPMREEKILKVRMPNVETDARRQAREAHKAAVAAKTDAVKLYEALQARYGLKLSKANNEFKKKKQPKFGKQTGQASSLWQLASSYEAQELAKEGLPTPQEMAQIGKKYAALGGQLEKAEVV
ncbi:hypothetical protein THASP1DRAFT_31655 [Thamnocephalis sphaerospora]|uniref:Uncharacterized protein n=1 Tax=Thamnocephalis sphaerospora TaxID=78915 RepID=A0A4P9XL55_9FUNG|nr:hypothetical protein THASP1DRAFT_31655 [Thamnocephalis sphaerospora]|eukprot:RKP06525.1 hypothetical protein THASP1DRAFT_31655 [Thamnocephalis sphaerospora]